jgi:DNA recombination protein RmuC
MVITGILIGLVLGAGGAWLVPRAQYASKFGVLEEARGSLETTMKALAADALASSNRSFLELAKSQLEQLQQKTTQDLDQRRQAVEHLVAPIKESLSKVDGKLQELEIARTRAYSELSTQVRTLAEGQKELRSETGNLVSALRDRPNVRGRWGEIQLRRVVEMAGMLEHCDFRRRRMSQQRTAGAAGPRREAPGSKTVVVDAKCAGQAYLESLVHRPEERAASFATCAQVRDHRKAVGEELLVAVRRDARVRRHVHAGRDVPERGARAGSRSEQGWNQQVIIATPTTLIALLRAVAYGWRQETIAESAKAISDLGRDLYTRLGTLTDHFAKVGRGLETAVRSYNEAVGSLETRVLPSARKFKEHGISPAAELAPLNIVERGVRPVTAPELPAADADAA